MSDKTKGWCAAVASVCAAGVLSAGIWIALARMPDWALCLVVALAQLAVLALAARLLRAAWRALRRRCQAAARRRHDARLARRIRRRMESERFYGAPWPTR